MNWNALILHNNSYDYAFEAFCIQLFEHYVRRKYGNDLANFFAISGSGGDGGIEAYADTISNQHLGLQAKWYRTSMTAGQIKSIKTSILTAKDNYPALNEYIICIPKRVNAIKRIGDGNKTKNDEQAKIRKLESEIARQYPDLKITWWFENILQEQLQFPDCQYVEAYWFGKSFLSFDHLVKRFDDQRKHAWLKLRYVPDLNAQGIISEHYEELSQSNDYKESLFKKLDKLDGKLDYTEKLIDEYITTLDECDNIVNSLQDIKASFIHYRTIIQQIAEACRNNQEPHLNILPEIGLWETKLYIERERPTNIQIAIVGNLVKALEDVHKIHVTQYLDALADHLRRRILLVFGPPGTGKTQGLAHSTQIHLNKKMPALIIPAKGTPAKSWTEILNAALELPTKSAEEIFTALEALVIIEIHRQALNEPALKHSAFALICVDGLEEDAGNKHTWYNRINDTENITKDFSRIRFIFSARDYFNDHEFLSEHVPFEKLSVPFDGDVSVRSVADDYFDHYGIRNVTEQVMGRIENLYALKLFCERYEGQDLQLKSDILTDLRSLLGKKIEALDEEYRNISERIFSPSSRPVAEVLQGIAAEFYTKTQIERKSLLDALQQTVKSLNYGELESMLDFLTGHGLLTTAHYETDDVFESYEIMYFVPYQSIVEHIITEKIYKLIIEAKIDHVPKIVIKGMVRPTSERFVDPESPFPNETIFRSLLKRVFIKTGKLVGINGFLSEGLKRNDLPALQMTTLAVAGEQLGRKFEALVESWLIAGPELQQVVYQQLIRPAIKMQGYFNARWLHERILSIPTVYERDKFLWEDRRKRRDESGPGIESVIYPFENYDTSLYPFDKFDDEPLIYAWCLSSPNRNFKREIRSSLLNWANLNITEWPKLISLMLRQDDTQILEDLSSVTLGLSHKHQVPDNIKQLAVWSIENIFQKPSPAYSSRILEGFRAIVERAVALGVLSESDANAARPSHKTTFEFLDVDEAAIRSGKTEFFPIVGDLSWYVINDAYEAFMEYNYPHPDEDGHFTADSIFLEQYARKYQLETLSPKQWAVAASIAFIRQKFGFLDQSGSLTFLPSHGEKGQIMYFAEKYTWQAVYYLQAYLSRHLKLIRHGHYIESFSAIVHVANPAEAPMHIFDQYDDFSELSEPGWIVPEHLVHTITDKKSITEEIAGGWTIRPSKWVQHNEGNLKWSHLYAKTQLDDKNNKVYGRITVNLVLIKNEYFNDILDILRSNPGLLYFVRSLGSMVASPDTSTYSNPTDVVANKNLGEDSSSTWIKIDSEEIKIEHSVVKISQSDRNNEIYHFIPSQLMRKLTNVVEIRGKRLRNELHKTIGFATSKTIGNKDDKQELTCMLTDVLEPAILKAGYSMLWFVEVFKRTTLKTEKEGFHLRKTKKFAVIRKGDEFEEILIWDKETSN